MPDKPGSPKVSPKTTAVEIDDKPDPYEKTTPSLTSPRLDNRSVVPYEPDESTTLSYLPKGEILQLYVKSALRLQDCQLFTLSRLLATHVGAAIHESATTLFNVVHLGAPPYPHKPEKPIKELNENFRVFVSAENVRKAIKDSSRGKKLEEARGFIRVIAMRLVAMGKVEEGNLVKGLVDRKSEWNSKKNISEG